MNSQDKKVEITREKVMQNIREILIYLGEDPDREGLKKTPERVLKSWDTLFGGYKMSSEKILETRFRDVGDYDEMVILDNIEFYSFCEHHMLPFFGKVHIGYLPDQEVLGISKLARLVDVHAKRLQTQELMTSSIANDLNNFLKPRGVGVIAEASHLCIRARGVGKQNSIMRTSMMLGAFRDNEATRKEFLKLIKGSQNYI
jgi:GTP cyclohydrolase I